MTTGNWTQFRDRHNTVGAPPRTAVLFLFRHLLTYETS